MSRGRDKREYTNMVVDLLKNTTFSYPKICKVVNKRYNTDLKRQNIYQIKTYYDIARPNKTNPSFKLNEALSEPRQPINQPSFIPKKAILEMLKLAKRKASEYQNKSLKDSYNTNLKTIEKWLKSV